jgi:hypothetical protein
MCMILDVVEVAKSHSGFNLATAFASVLKEFHIEHKVSQQSHSCSGNHPNIPRSSP